jgi:hypothetical protein
MSGKRRCLDHPDICGFAEKRKKTVRSSYFTARQRLGRAAGLFQIKSKIPF